MSRHDNKLIIRWAGSSQSGFFASEESNCKISMTIKKLKVIPPKKYSSDANKPFKKSNRSVVGKPVIPAKYSVQLSPSNTLGKEFNPIDYFEISVPFTFDVLCEQCVVCGDASKNIHSPTNKVYETYGRYIPETREKNLIAISKTKDFTLVPTYIECRISKSERHAKILHDAFDGDEYAKCSGMYFIQSLTIDSNYPHSYFEFKHDNYAVLENEGDCYVLKVLRKFSPNENLLEALLNTSSRIAASTIGADLVSVQPMQSPIGTLHYLDPAYVPIKPTYSLKDSIDIKIAERVSKNIDEDEKKRKNTSSASYKVARNSVYGEVKHVDRSMYKNPTITHRFNNFPRRGIKS